MTTGAEPDVALIALTAEGARFANERLQGLTRGKVHGLASRVSDADVTFDDAAVHLQTLFSAGTIIIAVMASGALIRLLAPVLGSKCDDPPVIAVSEDGASVVPLLGGHHGANQIARFLADELNGHAAITTAGDTRFSVALDNPPNGWTLANPDLAKQAMADLLAGSSLAIDDALCRADWIRKSDLPLVEEGSVRAKVSISDTESSEELVFVPKMAVLGLGCERGAEPDEVIALAEQALSEAGIVRESLAAIVSVDLKADETAIHAAAKHFGVPARFFSAERLEAETPRLANPSDIVFAEIGCHGVAEGAALAAAGLNGRLLLGKRKSKRATAAIGLSDKIIDVESLGRARGHLSVIGIGPGSDDWRSPEATRLVGDATDLVGYSLYLDLLGSLADGKTRYDYALGKEEDRVRAALELAGEGRNVALICSGDAGIYAMATLVYELLEDGSLSGGASRVSITNAPGISALQGASARAGAPLGHDFCTISLSDLLTPWPAIERRIKAAAEGDFVIAFYNPVSKRRRTQLAFAKEVLLEHRPATTPVILATNLGRDGETVRIVNLADLEVDEVDMLTVVIVGSSESKTVRTGDGREWAFTPRGYENKYERREKSA